jgi:hypothetical protein
MLIEKDYAFFYGISVNKKNTFISKGVKMGWMMGLEPTTPGTTIRCSAS